MEAASRVPLEPLSDTDMNRPTAPSSSRSSAAARSSYSADCEAPDAEIAPVLFGTEEPLAPLPDAPPASPAARPRAVTSSWGKAPAEGATPVAKAPAGEVNKTAAGEVAKAAAAEVSKAADVEVAQAPALENVVAAVEKPPTSAPPVVSKAPASAAPPAALPELDDLPDLDALTDFDPLPDPDVLPPLPESDVASVLSEPPSFNTLPAAAAKMQDAPSDWHDVSASEPLSLADEMPLEPLDDPQPDVFSPPPASTPAARASAPAIVPTAFSPNSSASNSSAPSSIAPMPSASAPAPRTAAPTAAGSSPASLAQSPGSAAAVSASAANAPAPIIVSPAPAAQATTANGAAATAAAAAAPGAMDRDFIARNQIVERYLSGKLPVKGASDFEKFCAENPSLLDELGLPERVNAGLRLLEAAGKPEPWQENPRRFWEKAPVVLGLAAGVLALLAVTGILWSSVSARDHRIAMLEKKATDQPLNPATSTRAIRLLPSYSGGSNTPAISIGGGPAQLADLKIDLSRSQYKNFKVTIDRIDQGRVGILHNLGKDSNGHLRIALNNTALGPGLYQFTIEGLTWKGETVPEAWATIAIVH